jgi:hypothetical protein
MKSVALIPLAALASAIVVPDQEVFAQLAHETAPEPQTLWDKLPTLGDVAKRIKKPFRHVPENLDRPSNNPLDRAFSRAEPHGCDHSQDSDFERPAFDFQAWIEHGLKIHKSQNDHLPHSEDEGPHPPRHHPPGPPHHRPGPPKGPHGPPGHRKPGKKPHKKPKHPHKRPGWHHHRPHFHKLNLTIYELISKSNYTKILAKYIDEDKELVSLLNSTKANYTLYAPADWAFKRRPKDFKPPKELVKKVLLYHISPGINPTLGLAWKHTTPTLLKPETLGGNPQRVLAKWLGPFKGLTLNYYAKIVAGDIVSYPTSCL